MDTMEDYLDRNKVICSIGDINSEIKQALEKNEGKIDENITKLYAKRQMQSLWLSIGQ